MLPPEPGLLCAWGALVADVVRDVTLTRIDLIEGGLSARVLEPELAPLVARAQAALDGEGVPNERRIIERRIDLRYVGQSYELSIPITKLASDEDDDLLERFHVEHVRRYGFANRAWVVERVALRVRGRGIVLTPPPLPVSRDASASPWVERSKDAMDSRDAMLLFVRREPYLTVIHVDPWSRGDYSSAKPADLILITDTSSDHLDPELIATLRKAGTPVVLSDRPEGARDERSRELLIQVPNGTVMDNGDRMTLAGVGIEAVPMYDIIPGDPFHTKGEGNGYVLTLGETRVYVAGVTECVPEMRSIRDIDIAFIPMNLPHGRMEPLVAAECVKMIRPSVVYPYHYREMPIDAFVAALRGEAGIEVRVHDWYPPTR